MTVRQNVWDLGSDWADPILWYARGVKAMKARALADPNGWRFWGAIHGLDEERWQHYGYLTPGEAKPAQLLIDKYWNQCQHGSWYFLPWHRGYLLAFEATIRAEVVALHGPADWALPYWNYFKEGQSDLPHAFGSPNWPDGHGDNPLYVEQRWGPQGDGNVTVPVDQINLDAMGDPDFTGAASGGSPGFGGIDTGFMHGGRHHGGVETQPHDYVHGLVGGPDPADPNNPRRSGLMAYPDTAGLDPIFWLHHANIDRLWEIWRHNPATHLDPTNARWLAGPVLGTGEDAFSLPMPGAIAWDYTPAQMVNLAALGYSYDDVSPPPGVATPAERLFDLAGEAAVALAAERIPAMDEPKNVELVGANAERIAIRGNLVQTSVQLEPGTRKKVSASLLSAVETATPDRVFLNLENVQGQSDATAFSVYVDIPHGDKPVDHPERLAGSIALFGVSKASDPNEEHAGQGLNYVLEISRIVDALHLEDKLDADNLQVSIVPLRPVPDEAEVSIGRISIYRQGR
jgi:tyrosinase